MFAALQSGFIQREPRRKVLVPSRMKTDSGWVDVCIHNISTKGIMVGADNPPATGSYVDIRRGTITIIGRVVWRDGRFFGLFCQGKLNIDAVVNEPRLAGKPSREAVSEELNRERRASDRLSSEAAAARRLERSRAFSSALQFGLVAIAGVSAAGFAAFEVYELLSAPAQAVGTALGAAR